MRDYGVSNGNVLHLVLRLSDLQVINVRTCCGKEFTFHVEKSRDVAYVKRQIAKKRNFEHVEDQDFLLNNELIEDQTLINDLSKDNSYAVIYLLVRKSAKIRATPVGKNFVLSIVAPQLNDPRRCGVDSKHDHNLYVPTKTPVRERVLEPVIVNPKILLSPEISDLIHCTMNGLDSGKSPIRSSEGTGGAYFMLDSSGTKYLSVFKPIDEEPMAVNNPRGLPLSEDGEGLKKGTRVGEGAIRECAVYLLDLPMTGRRSFTGEDGVSVKTGSLQMFIIMEVVRIWGPAPFQFRRCTRLQCWI